MGPDLPALEMVVAGGDGQYGTPGQRLGAPLQVLVRRVDTGAHQSGLAVQWAVEGGDATLATTSVGTTDGDGYAEAVVQLGTTPGVVRVRATLRDRTEVSVVLEAHVVEHPRLQGLSAPSARGGDTLTLAGAAFSPTPDQNVVLFSGIRGRVVEAGATSLRVEVPRCLPVRPVSVTVQLGLLVSEALPLDVVEDRGQPVDLGAGVPLDVQDDFGFTCVRLPGGGPGYLVMVESTGTVGAARYGFTLSGLVATETAAPAARRAPAGPPVLGPHVPTVGAQEAFDARLRALEASLVRGGASAAGPAGVAPAQARGPSATVPSVGDKRSFKVFKGSKEGQIDFDDVTAVARLVSAQAVFYVDERAPAGGFTDQDLGRFAADFDEIIFPTDTAAFGAPSDLDGNQRVVILLTPTVNSLTPRGSSGDGFIGGFFYGLDLLDRDGSNHAEIFYGIVPDSTGLYGDARYRQSVMEVMPAILAHEFQHMIHFNQRVLKLGADGTEALWLSEGMAQMAEELVARAYLKVGDAPTAEQYRDGNRKRARSYLGDPSAVSLIVSTGQGSLAERGAGWLHVLYLWDRGGGDETLRRLTQTIKTGTANVAAAMGASWPDVFSDWAASLYLD
ncbi:MAG TPA: hypothetical protein VJ997_13970, partial [Longimicrobiales bacterium]|nr:hypothetical protein [Longimicrobiales bacterium]